MNKYKIEEILSNIQFQVYSDMNFIEPLGLDKETWKELLEYINKYKIILDKIKDKCLENMYIDDRGEEVESIERDIKPSEILELLEEIE